MCYAEPDPLPMNDDTGSQSDAPPPQGRKLDESLNRAKSILHPERTGADDSINMMKSLLTQPRKQGGQQVTKKSSGTSEGSGSSGADTSGSDAT